MINDFLAEKCGGTLRAEAGRMEELGEAGSVCDLDLSDGGE